jgi:hypothetical protein
MSHAKRLMSVILALTLIMLCGVCTSAATGKGEDEEIKVRRVEMVLDSITVRVNQTKALYATITPSDAEDQELCWDSSNWEIVSVDGDGEITGISPGTAEVTATSENGKVGRCIVTVPDTVIRSNAFIPDIENKDIPGSDINGGEILRALALRVDAENAVKTAGKGKTAQLIYKDKTQVSTAALRGAAYAAKTQGGAVALKIQTLADDGRVQGQLTINPDKTSDVDDEIRISVYTEYDRVKAVLEKAKSHYSSDVAAIYLPQQNDFGMEVQVAAKIAVDNIQIDGSTLYRYANGEYTKTGTDIWMDSNGFLHFTTSRGGYFVLAYRPI